MQLNKKAYEVGKDNLIYDGSHDTDVKNVEVTVSKEGGGVLLRGQILDFAEGAYSVHAANGTANAIVAESMEYTEDDETVIVPVYISGTFRQSACLTDAELTVKDVEALRSAGIFLK